MSRIQQAIHAPVPDPNATDLYLVFPPSRGTLVRAYSGPRDAADSRETIIAVRVPGSRFTLRLPLGKFSTSKESLLIRLTTADEPMTPAYFVEDLGTRRRVVGRSVCNSASSQPKARTFAMELTDKPVSELLLDKRTYTKSLLDSLEVNVDPDLDPLRPYFVQLEAASNPDVIPPGSTIPYHVRIVTQHLRRRVRYRAILADRYPGQESQALTNAPTPALVQSVRTMSRLQLGLVDACFGSGAGFDEPKFRRAFEAFANGELRRPVTLAGLQEIGYWITQPSSAYFLFFAEFAFLACECNVDVDRWSRLACAMTYTQAVFATAYAPPHAQARFPDFKADNFEPHKRMSNPGITMLRAHALGKRMPDLRVLASNTVRTHVPKHGSRFP